MDNIINMGEFIGAAAGDKQHMLGKFLYFSSPILIFCMASPIPQRARGDDCFFCEYASIRRHNLQIDIVTLSAYQYTLVRAVLQANRCVPRCYHLPHAATPADHRGIPDTRNPSALRYGSAYSLSASILLLP